MAGDVLDDEERLPLASRPAIEQSGDIAMFKSREDLALAAEARGDVACPVWCADELHRDAMIERAIAPDPFVHGPHPAVADDPHQPIAPDEPDAQQVDFDLIPMDAVNRAELVRGLSATFGKADSLFDVVNPDPLGQSPE
jgi:hypothetical protein